MTFAFEIEIKLYCALAWYLNNRVALVFRECNMHELDQ